MREKIELLIHFTFTLAKLLKPGGVKTVMAETMTTKQQLIVLNRGSTRAPKLTSFDRFFFGLMAFFISKNRLKKVAVILKPATILRFHKALIQRKYSKLYSNKIKKKPGRKGPDQALIDLIITMRNRNPLVGYGRISMQIYKEFGIEISRFAVGRILRNHFKNNNPGKGEGPSWLTFIGHMNDSLWSVDLFRCESISLKSHWVMVVLDQYTRRIIGFAVHAGDCNGVAYCRMFNKIISGHPLPKYLSSDNDPLFEFNRWQANLRILEIEELKSIPGIPESHPFIERVIGTTRREYLDHMLFFNERDLQNKLDHFKKYYNETRAHSSLGIKTPKEMRAATIPDKKVVLIDDHRLISHCRGLYQFPITA